MCRDLSSWHGERDTSGARDFYITDAASATVNNTVTIQFSTTKNIWSWRPPFFPNYASFVIRHMTHSPFSHCDFELPDGTLLGASDSPKAPILSGNSRGVAIRPAHYEDYGLRRRMIIKTDKADAIIAFAMSQLGKPFDHSALYSFWSDAAPGTPGSRDWHDPAMWFCAELLVRAFEFGGFWSPVPQWPMTRITPPDIFMMLLFDPRWINSATFWTDPKYLRG